MVSRYCHKRDPYSSHTQIAQKLIKIWDQVGNNRTCSVLDVGCSEGFIGSSLADDRFSFVGIDNDASFLAKLPSIYKLGIDGDIEDPELVEKLESLYDVLVFADVLEHTRDPESCLRNFLKTLRPDGYVIISLPNIAHLFIRLNLLLGKFDYSDRGILDRTHLRFFTVHNGFRLCQQANLEIIKFTVTPVPLPLIHYWFEKGKPLFWIHVLNAVLALSFKKLLGYQMIFVCKFVMR